MSLNPRITQRVSYLCFLVPYGLLGMFFVLLVLDDSYWRGLDLFDALYMVIDTVSKGVLVLAPATVVRGLLFAKRGIWRPFWALLVGGATSGFGFLSPICATIFSSDGLPQSCLPRYFQVGRQHHGIRLFCSHLCAVRLRTLSGVPALRSSSSCARASSSCASKNSCSTKRTRCRAPSRLSRVVSPSS